ncbi:hypothetical protein K437DRAFT_162153 [Tilletiaria anomala UBC 951]|uniref:Uncharacterized protein n=1 Tax=Tilletiaria anomala (strain ATCC 24038 / CBS 436.72 / UBC 951) TaxID=1037660 RepID=A0A066WNY4_TILAU|nr:uncharacterized protein K437DRAFT_162153 [Tilletiaria anomala UBC 951]KDN52714.1 hypothetical protein K437DRAFT_162153 [Tilletiaria anomala UBC 951]
MVIVECRNCDGMAGSRPVCVVVHSRRLCTVAGRRRWLVRKTVLVRAAHCYIPAPQSTPLSILQVSSPLHLDISQPLEDMGMSIHASPWNNSFSSMDATPTLFPLLMRRCDLTTLKSADDSRNRVEGLGKAENWNACRLLYSVYIIRAHATANPTYLWSLGACNP